MLRDIHQLRDAPPFAVTAVEGLMTVEQMLQESLRYVPYCDKHRKVWSSHFASIILESASQVDSVWKAAADSTGCTGKLRLEDHFNRFGSLVAKQHVVFFGGHTPCVLSPFEVWKTAFSPPAWWDAYNKLKHDRFENQTEGTLDHAANAVAAHLLAIIYSGTCDVALLSSALVDAGSRNLWAYTTGLVRDVTFDCRAKVETRLFAHPLGIFGRDDCNLSNDWMSCSTRFNIWWALHAHEFTKPRTKP